MDYKSQVRETFSKNAEAYVTSSTHSKEKDLQLIMKWLKAESDWVGLDIATGGGHVAKYLAKEIKSVFATDITKGMLQNTARHLSDYKNISYVIADAEELPFLDNTFDIVTCRIAPHHFPNPAKFIEEVHRVLKPGGKFLMIDNVAPEPPLLDTFYNQLEKLRDKSHVRALKISEWEAFLKKHKLSKIKSQLRRKKLPYQEWVTRTLKEPMEINQVHQLMAEASADIKDYFLIEEQDNSVISFEIDEWMVLAVK